jgi:hypothetical protein
MTPTPIYWPFPVLPPEQRTEQHQKEVRFLEDAHRAGFRPCKFADGEYRIESGDGRTAWVIARGRLRGGVGTRWEVWLNDGIERITSNWADGFDSATTPALDWVSAMHREGTADQFASTTSLVSASND